MDKKAYFPFTAIVGQEKMKRALILNLINPALGGVLIKGEKGTAKSTAVRALTEVLPEREEVENCPFSCDPHDRSCQCESCRSKEHLTAVKRRMRVVDLPVSERSISKGRSKRAKSILNRVFLPKPTEIFFTLTK